MPRIALNTAFAADDLPPKAVQLIPAGKVTGHDGREWLFDADAANQVLNAFQLRGKALPIDWEHATQHRAPKGLDAPAAAWVDNLHLVDGALVGDVSWTDRGSQQVINREYRYLSPVFDYDPSTGRILRLVSAGLTNLPNLTLTALNTETDEEPPMKRSTALIAAMVAAGLAEDADDDSIAKALTAKQAANAEIPSPERYIPRADYDAAVRRASNAEQTLAERDKAAFKAEVETEITGALTAGQITPASADHYRALCADASGLAQFRALRATLPVIGEASGLDKKKAPGTETALNAEELKVIELTGISREDFIAQRSLLSA